MSLFGKYNNENILIRGVIAGLLDVLNNKIKYEQVWSDDDVETIKVPWYYNMSGDERFMQDMYTHYGECLAPRPADGNFDFIPRGIITYTGANISNERMTSRFVQGRYVKEENGQLNQYVSFLYSIPLNAIFDAEMWVDTHLTALKLEQEIREEFYRNVTFYVYYKGMRVGCTAGFPEEYNVDKNIDYSFEEKNKIKLTFKLEVEVYQPVFDPTTEMNASNRMKSIGYDLHDENNTHNSKLLVTTPQAGKTFPKNVPIWIEWQKLVENPIINKVNIKYTQTGDNKEYTIATGVPNKEHYIWNIPENFNDFKEPNIMWQETDETSIVMDPLLKITPDVETGEINKDSFHVIEQGFFNTIDEDASIAIDLEMKDDDGNIQYSESGIYINIKYNKIDKKNPVTLEEPIQFPGTVDYKEIDIRVYNADDSDVYAQTSNIKIV
ncbi:MAG: hypothetical protein ACOC22_00800 [bacterium]